MGQLSNSRNVLVKKSLVLVVVLSFVWISIMGYIYITRTSDYESDEVVDSLKTITHNNSSMVEFDFNKYINILSVTANNFADMPIDFDYFENKFNELVVLENFDKLAAVLPNGDSYVADGINFTRADYDFSEKMNTNKVFITDVYFDSEEIGNVVSINVPIINEQEELLAYLVGILSVDSLSIIFNDLLYTMDGYYHIIDSNGNYVALSNSNAMLHMDVPFEEGLSQVKFDAGYDAKSVMEDFKARNDGVTKYYSNNENRYAYYNPININAWTMYNVVLENDVNETITYHIFNAVWLCSSFALVFIIHLVLVVRSQKKFNRKSFEYERNFRFVSEQINKFIVEWDFNNDTFTIRGNYENLLNKNYFSGIWSKDLNSGFIYKDDISLVKQNFDEVKKGKTISDMRIRIHHDNDDYVWCALNVVPINNEKGNYTGKALGFLEDIEDIMIESIELKKQSELDSLTNIYNKGTTEKLIKMIVESADKEKDKHALLIIDVDNFKEINDIFGHQYGDKVIVELANKLEKMFRNEDIIGRIGGDEYFAFMKNIPNNDIVVAKANKICEEFNVTYNVDGKVVTISASVGIAIYPQHGESFEKLYKKADLALYTSKENGKNTFNIYDGQVNSNYKSNRTKIDSGK